ncbi:hypothetical protein [Kitasatospora sp. NPDC058046]|uniref:hypothetical protein n=1 Tax=Kitasatospora sp. NPDC058046 TaxID=3346312 RepID=UPI0036DE5EDB
MPQARHAHIPAEACCLAYQLITGNARASITVVALVHPAQPDGPWAITLTTADNTRYRLTVIEDEQPTAVGGEPAQPVVYRVGTPAVPLGTYSTRAAARQHAEDHVQAQFRTPPTRWEPEDPEPDQGQTLYVLDASSEIATAFTVTPVTVQNAYDPEADG